MWGEDRKDLRAGMVASAVINSVAVACGGRATSKPGDFIIGHGKSGEPSEVDKTLETRNRMFAWAAGHNLMHGHK